MKNKENILITGARAPIALEMARSFRIDGHRVVMADSFHLTIARWSNAIDRYIVIPSPRKNLSVFKFVIQKLVKEENITQIIPTCEEAFYFSKIKDELSCKVWTCDIEIMNRLHNKWMFAKEWKQLLQTPETSLLSEFNDWDNTENYVFKPIYSRFANATIIGKKIEGTYFKRNEQNAWIVQKFVLGKEICAYSIWDNGIMKACVLYHPLFRVGKGSGIFFEPINNPEITNKIEQAGTQLKYTGQLCFDIILTNENIPHFIECNPRGTSGAHLINLDLAKAFLSEEKNRKSISKEYSIKYALFLLKPFSLFTKRVRRSKDVIFQKKDIAPLFLQALSLLEITVRKLKNRSTWLEATTSDIEWNGDEN